MFQAARITYRDKRGGHVSEHELVRTAGLFRNLRTSKAQPFGHVYEAQRERVLFLLFYFFFSNGLFSASF